jgi:hypothetical protein
MSSVERILLWVLVIAALVIGGIALMNAGRIEDVAEQANAKGRTLTAYLSNNTPATPTTPGGFYWWMDHTTKELHELGTHVANGTRPGGPDNHSPPPPPPPWD